MQRYIVKLQQRHLNVSFSTFSLTMLHLSYSDTIMQRYSVKLQQRPINVSFSAKIELYKIMSKTESCNFNLHVTLALWLIWNTMKYPRVNYKVATLNSFSRIRFQLHQRYKLHLVGTTVSIYYLTFHLMSVSDFWSVYCDSWATYSLV